MRLFGKKKQQKHDEYDTLVIVREQTVSLDDLRKTARNASNRFWALLVSFTLIASMFVPFMSNAASVATASSNAFTGEVIPGYSMGGIELAAFGIDLNDWGKVNANTFVKSNYGIWSKTRADNARTDINSDKNLVDMANTHNVVTESTQAANNTITQRDKALGWQLVTDAVSFSSTTPDGIPADSLPANDATKADFVSPYRSPADYSYWDAKAPTSSSNASADITVSLVPDFIVVAKYGDYVYPITSPDEVTNLILNQQSVKEKGSDSDRFDYTVSGRATPYYVSLRDLMNTFVDEKDKSKRTMSALISALSWKTDNERKEIAKKFMNLASDENLLKGTEYSSWNRSEGQLTSKAWNPFPYSMVFSYTNDKGARVVSSIYDNSEAYVYFSPSSVYSAYMNLKQEYEDLKAQHNADIMKYDKNAVDPIITFQLGYYAAAMAICDAYLEESLPQDMTRGYVGPSEDKQLYKTGVGTSDRSELATSLASSAQSGTFSNKSISYPTLMYDVASNVPQSESEERSAVNLNETNAIMDTLSTLAYANYGARSALGWDPKASGKGDWNRSSFIDEYTATTSGPMRGMSKDGVYSRPTMFTAHRSDYDNDNDVTGAKNSSYLNVTYSTMEQISGFYTPVYYPIQQHKMPQAERTYRFQVLSAVPYESVLALIERYGFSKGVRLTYNSAESDGSGETAIVNFDAITDETKTKDIAQLASQYENAANDGPTNMYLSDISTSTRSESGVNVKQLEVLGGTGSEASRYIADVESTSRKELAQTAAARVDTALQSYIAGNMSADNVHDLMDVLRGVVGMRSETFSRFYNPIKSEGGDNDFFLSRVTPADTVYMPSALISGYTPAATSLEGNVNPLNVHFNYFAPPSLAPCLAAHSASDCYYGVMNYEYRAFYTEKFLKTMSENANIPALELQEKAKAEAASIENELAKETQAVRDGIGALYVLAKRVACLDALVEMGSSDTFSWKDFVNQKKMNEDKAIFEGKYDDDEHNMFTIKEKRNDHITLASNMLSAALFAHDWRRGSNIHLDFEGTSDNNVSVSQGDMTLTRYYKELHAFLDNGGTYYWMPWEKISSNLESGKATPSSDMVGAYNKAEYDIQTVYLEEPPANDFWDAIKTKMQELLTGSAKYDLSQLKSLAQSYGESLDHCGTLIYEALQEKMETKDRLNNQSPSKMQNVIGWADYQMETDSENQYRKPANTNDVVINVSNQTQQSMSSSPIRKASDLSKYGFKFDPETEELTATSSSDGDDDSASYQAKMRAGVEGASALPSTQPAEYTISSTVARSESLAKDAGTTYPYSGLVVSRLQSGADQYSTLQSHVVDYTSISSGVAGDLATEQRANAMTISNPEYAALTDFSNVASNVSALAGETGSTTSAGSKKVFEGVFYNTQNGGGAVAINNDLVKNDSGRSGKDVAGKTKEIADGGSGAATAESAAASPLYMTRDGITMNRLPASLASYSYADSKLVYSSAPMASAAGNSSGYSLSGLLLGAGATFYQFFQTVGLMLVMLSIGVIGFRNFYAYSIADDENMIKAQMQLKVVLPRAILAIFMIGLPPLTATSVGFEGGNFVLLRLLDTIINTIGDVFVNGQGTAGGATSILFSPFSSSGFGLGDLGTTIVWFIGAMILSLCYMLGSLAVILQQLCLVGFYALGPIAWGFYVWTEGGDEKEYTSNKSNVITMITDKMYLGMFSGHKVGNKAPIGLIVNYVIIAGLSIMWGIMFWVIAVVYSVLAGNDAINLMNSGAPDAGAGPLAALAVVGAISGLTGDSMGIGANPFSMLRVMFATAVSVALFFWMWLTMWRNFKKSIGSGKGIVRGLRKAVGAVMNNPKAQALKESVKTVAEVAKPVLGDVAQQAEKVLKNKAKQGGKAGKVAGGLAKTLETGRKVAEKAKPVMNEVKEKGAKGALTDGAKKVLSDKSKEKITEKTEKLKNSAKNNLKSLEGLKAAIGDGSLKGLEAKLKADALDEGQKKALMDRGIIDKDGKILAGAEEKLKKLAGSVDNDISREKAKLKSAELAQHAALDAVPETKSALGNLASKSLSPEDTKKAMEIANKLGLDPEQAKALVAALKGGDDARRDALSKGDTKSPAIKDADALRKAALGKGVDPEKSLEAANMLLGSGKVSDARFAELSTKEKAGRLTEAEANELHAHRVAESLDNADVSKYRGLESSDALKTLDADYKDAKEAYSMALSAAKEANPDMSEEQLHKTAMASLSPDQQNVLENYKDMRSQLDGSQEKAAALSAATAPSATKKLSDAAGALPAGEAKKALLESTGAVSKIDEAMRKSRNAEFGAAMDERVFECANASIPGVKELLANPLYGQCQTMQERLDLAKNLCDETFVREHHLSVAAAAEVSQAITAALSGGALDQTMYSKFAATTEGAQLHNIKGAAAVMPMLASGTAEETLSAQVAQLAAENGNLALVASLSSDASLWEQGNAYKAAGLNLGASISEGTFNALTGIIGTDPALAGSKSEIYARATAAAQQQYAASMIEQLSGTLSGQSQAVQEAAMAGMQHLPELAAALQQRGMGFDPEMLINTLEPGAEGPRYTGTQEAAVMELLRSQQDFFVSSEELKAAIKMCSYSSGATAVVQQAGQQRIEFADACSGELVAPHQLIIEGDGQMRMPLDGALMPVQPILVNADGQTKLPLDGTAVDPAPKQISGAQQQQQQQIAGQMQLPLDNDSASDQMSLPLDFTDPQTQVVQQPVQQQAIQQPVQQQAIQQPVQQQAIQQPVQQQVVQQVVPQQQAEQAAPAVVAAPIRVEIDNEQLSTAVGTAVGREVGEVGNRIASEFKSFGESQRAQTESLKKHWSEIHRRGEQKADERFRISERNARDRAERANENAQELQRASDKAADIRMKRSDDAADERIANQTTVLVTEFQERQSSSDMAADARMKKSEKTFKEQTAKQTAEMKADADRRDAARDAKNAERDKRILQARQPKRSDG